MHENQVDSFTASLHISKRQANNISFELSVGDGGVGGGGVGGGSMAFGKR